MTGHGPVTSLFEARPRARWEISNFNNYYVRDGGREIHFLRLNENYFLEIHETYFEREYSTL